MGVEQDGVLVARARAGEKEAFGLLIVRHQGMARTVAQRVLRDADLAADAVQEAAATALVGLDRLADPDRFGAWLCGIALNVARSWTRRDRPTTQIAPDLPDDAPGPEQLAQTRWLHDAVAAAIAALPAGQREATYLYYLQGLTHREVAAELQISPGAVKNRLHHARAALKPKLAIHQEEPMTAQVTISEVRRSAGDDPDARAHTVLLRPIDGPGLLAIWIGPAEATALALAIEDAPMPRPGTYQLLLSLLQATGATLTEVRISRLDDGIYYATLNIDGQLGRQQIDVRPSDALNLAALLDCPIRVATDLIDPEPDTGWLDKYPVTSRQLATEVHHARTRTPRSHGL